jgi:outer membrane autotransporter protein
MDYSSSDIVDYSSNAPTAYETRSGYCGLSTGFGHVNHIGDFSLNAYCRYIWTHQNGNNVILSTGKYLEVKSSSSLRLQAGLIASHKISDLLQIYLGAGYEHESNGKIEAKINGHDVESPSLSGNTGKGELGLSFLNESLSISFGVQGSVGACRGVQGKPQVAFNL